MANRIFVAVMVASAVAAAGPVVAAEPAGAEPARPLDERVTNDDRGPGDRPDKNSAEGLDSTGPAQPRGLAPAAPQSSEGPAECRRLPRDARQACMEGSSRSRQDPPLPTVPRTPSPKVAPES